MSVAAPLVLRPGDELKLKVLMRSPTVEAGLAQRARIVLLAAEGLPNAAIARQAGVSRPTDASTRTGPGGPVRVDAADQPFLARSAIVFSLNLSAVSLVTTIASLSCASAWSRATRLLGNALPSAA